MKNKENWIFNADIPEKCARKLLDEWAQYSWLAWKLSRTIYVPEENYDSLKAKVLNSIIAVSYTHLTLPTTPYV